MISVEAVAVCALCVLLYDDGGKNICFLHTAEAQLGICSILFGASFYWATLWSLHTMQSSFFVLTLSQCECSNYILKWHPLATLKLEKSLMHSLWHINAPKCRTTNIHWGLFSAAHCITRFTAFFGRRIMSLLRVSRLACNCLLPS